MRKSAFSVVEFSTNSLRSYNNMINGLRQFSSFHMGNMAMFSIDDMAARNIQRANNYKPERTRHVAFQTPPSKVTACH